MTTNLIVADIYGVSDNNNNNNSNNNCKSMTTPLLESLHEDLPTAVASLEQGQETDYKVKLSMMTLSFIIGYCVHIAAMLTSSSTNYAALVLLGALATVLLACVVCMLVNRRLPSSSWRVKYIFSLILALLCFQGGLFMAWVVPDYRFVSSPKRFSYHFLVETLCMFKFILLTCVMEHDERSIMTTTTATSTEQTTSKVTTMADSSNNNSSSNNLKWFSSEYKLQVGSLLFSYVLGYGISTTFFVAPRDFNNVLIVVGTLVTILQAWIASRHFSWARCLSQHSVVVDLILWVAAAVLCFQGGFYSAWSFHDFMLEMYGRFVFHSVQEVLCIVLCLVFVWAIHFDRSEVAVDADDDYEMHYPPSCWFNKAATSFRESYLSLL